MNLFTEEGDEETASAPELATPKQVRLLEGFHYRREAVRLWTREKAETVLRNCQREERIALNRAMALAKEQGGELPERGQVSQVERLTAATFLEQSQGQGIDELCQAVAYSVYVLSDDELKRLASYLIRVYRGELAQKATEAA